MDNFKSYLKNNQHIVYETLKNAFKNNKTSHAYLISGAKGSPILDTAILMAESFVCLNKDENSLACENCINCQKIIKNGYADFKIFNGEELKTDAVLKIQEEFNKSAMEEKGIKIYIVNLIEKAPLSSLNKLLKFIEEPTSDIVAIFTTNSLSSVLPTIVSRCQTISLKEFTLKELVDYLINQNINKEDAYLISRISNNAEYNLNILKSETYPLLKDVLNEALKHFVNKSDMFIVYMQIEGLKKLNENNYLDLFLDMFQACLLEAVIYQEDNKYVLRFYNEEIRKIAMNYQQLDKLIQIITQTKIELLSNANQQLVLDKMLINLLRK